MAFFFHLLLGTIKNSPFLPRVRGKLSIFNIIKEAHGGSVHGPNSKWASLGE